MGSTGVSQRTARMTQNAAPRTRAQRARDAKGTSQKGSKLPFIIGGIVAVVVVAVLAFVVVPRLTSKTTTDDASTVAAGQMVDVAIPDGSGATAIATILKDAGVISSTEDFYKEVTTQKADQSLQPGTYSFVTGSSVSEVVKQLVAGPSASSTKLTIPEGYTVTKTAAIVESSLGISQDDFLAQAKASNYVADYPFLSGVQDDSLEGYLYAMTYDFAGQDITADSVIRTMLNAYQSKVAGMDFASGEAQIQTRYGVTMSDYQVLILASIIEKEAVTDDDRPLVSSVFYNRLQQGMALQSDATMGYVTGGDVTAADLQTSSPYNTYLNKGLPPTPICTPSSASINAALAPTDTNYLYFLIIENGSYSNHTFSETYDEHQAAIAAAQSAQAS